MLSKMHDPEFTNDKPFIYLVPGGSGVYRCQGMSTVGFGITMRTAYERWCAKVR